MPGKSISEEIGISDTVGRFPANCELKIRTRAGGMSNVKNAKLLRVR